MKTRWHGLLDQASPLNPSPWLCALALALMIAFAVSSNHTTASAQASKALGANSTDTRKLAKEAFERFKRLDGKWTGRSTKGWQESIMFKTIAQGSVVHENSFDAHPNETMATMYYLDGERLLLTHYCVSKTQPRLLATAFENGGRKITFTFLDGGNLPSRDKGHMDKVIFNFVDNDHITSQWTWYQSGQEKWLEEIQYERSK